MQIIRGKTSKAMKIVIYGPEGIGKTTFAAGAPDPLFIDVEDSTAHMDVARLQKPMSWSMLMQQIRWVKDNKPCETLVIDSGDWAEMMCQEHVLQKNQWSSIEDPGYGKGWIYLTEEFSRFLNLLSDVVDVGIHVIVTAHAQVRKHEEPTQMGAYDRYELKLSKRSSPVLKEWADLLLFATYETEIITDSKTKTKRAMGGKRVMHTSHHPAFDAKNRMGLPEKMDLDIDQIRHLFEERADAGAGKARQFTAPPTTSPAPTTATTSAPETHNQDFSTAAETAQPASESTPEPEKATDPRLAQLLVGTGYDISDLVRALGPKKDGGLGYMPGHATAEDYPTDFVDFIVSSWDAIYQHIQDTNLPFEL